MCQAPWHSKELRAVLHSWRHLKLRWHKYLILQWERAESCTLMVLLTKASTFILQRSSSMDFSGV